MRTFGIARVDGHGAVAELASARRACPGVMSVQAPLRVFELPDGAVDHRHRAGIGAVADEEISVGGQDGVVGTVPGGLPGDRLPGDARVVAAEQTGPAHDRDAREDASGWGCPARAAARIEDDEHDAAAAAAAPGGQLGLVGRELQHVAGEGRHLRPGGRAVGALPQAALARAQEQHAAVVGIDGHPLAVAAARPRCLRT